ncbi:MAG: sodium:calcium exchanger [Chloroflexota bacterium]
MSIWFWWIILLLAVWAAHWGADQLAEPLQKIREQWGLSAAAGGVLIAIATASPEVSTNTASALQDATDIGVGNLLGSNIISVPAIVTVAYLATWMKTRTQGRPLSQPSTHTLVVDELANPIQSYPYIIIIILVGILTLPAPWRGLQPIDGVIMLIAYIAYAGQAILRGRTGVQTVSWSRREVVRAIGGVLALVVAAYFTVRATEQIVVALGISEVIGGLFITATMSIVPEVFATWSIARSGQVTSATTSVIADNSVTMTLAFLPLALVSTPIQDFQLFWVNLLFVGLLAIAYAAAIRINRGERGFGFGEIILLNSIYIVYILIMLLVVL